MRERERERERAGKVVFLWWLVCEKECAMLNAQQILQPPTRAITYSYFFNRKIKIKICNFYFFHIWLSWENIINSNTIVILLAHTPITDCQISKSVKSIIKFSVYLDFLYSTLLWNLLSLSERKWECARKKRKRGKIQLWTSYYKFANGPDYYKPTFFITITIIFYCCMGLGL